MKAFVSHPRELGDEARQLGVVLAREGVTAFVDAFDLQGGEDWDKRVRAEVTSSTLVFVLMPEHGVSSERYFHLELELIERRSRARGVTVCVLVFADPVLESAPEPGVTLAAPPVVTSLPPGLRTSHRLRVPHARRLDGSWTGIVLDALQPILLRRRRLLQAATALGLLGVLLASGYTWVHRTPEYVHRARARPVVVDLIGPTTGTYVSFGQTQLRGVLAGLMHVVDSRCGLDPRSFRQIFEVRLVDEYPSLIHQSSLEEPFEQSQATAAVVFGPASSESAIRVVGPTSPRLRVPVILTTAATPVVRGHPDYGAELYQVSAGISVYVSQLVQYLAEKVRPNVIAVAYRSDEYGNSTYAAVTREAGQRGIRVVGKKYQVDAPGESDAKREEAMDGAIDAVLGEAATTPGPLALILAEVGPTLGKGVQYAHRGHADVVVASPTSVEKELVATGDFDSAILEYSFPPDPNSVKGRRFKRWADVAEATMPSVLSGYTEHAGRDPSTTDAEIHDATLFWANKYFLPYAGPPCTTDPVQEFATDFVVEGQGPAFANRGALWLFRVEGTRMVAADFGDHPE